MCNELFQSLVDGIDVYHNRPGAAKKPRNHYYEK